MNLGKLIGILYALVILAFIAHFADAKQYDGNGNSDR